MPSLHLPLLPGIEWLRAGALALVAVLLGLLAFRLGIERLVCRIYRAHPDASRQALSRLRRAYWLVLALVAANAFRGLSGAQADWWLGVLLGPAVALFGLEALRLCVVDYLLLVRRGPAVPKILRDIAFGVVYAVLALSYLGTVFRVDLTPLLTTSAILSVVLGMALQDTLGNLFAGLAINLDRPFNLDDWIAIDGEQGQVVEITWRATKIVNRRREMLIIPNNAISKAKVINYHLPTPTYSEDIDVGLPLDVPPHRVRQAALEVAGTLREVLREPAPEVLLLRYTETALVYRFKLWISGGALSAQVRSRFHEGLWYRLQREGIPLPVPGRTVRVLDQEATLKAVQAEHLRVLGQVDVIACMDPHSVASLAARAEAQHFRSGERIFRQGDLGGSLYVIKAGRVALLLEAEGARPLATLGEGDFFGEMSLLTGQHRTASAVAATDCELLVIDRRHLAPLLEAHPEFMRLISQTIATRRQDTASLMADLEQARAATVAQAPAAAAVEEASNEILSRIRSFFKLG